MKHDDSKKYESLARLLQEARADSFGPYFSDRVISRLLPQHTASSAEALYDALRWVFVRTSMVGLVVIAVLCVANALAFHDLGIATTMVDTLFGLPSASISDALSFGAL